MTRNIPVEMLMYETTGQIMPAQVEEVTVRQDDTGVWVVRAGAETLSTHPSHAWQAAFESAADHGMSRIGDAGVMSA